MPLPFLSDAWTDALCRAINRSEAYAREAAGWDHGPVVLNVELPEGVVRHLVIEVAHGTCRQVYLAPEPPDAVFRLTGTLAAWRRLLEERLSPAAEIAKRHLVFQGNWVLLARYQDAARTLVALTADLDTAFDG